MRFRRGRLLALSLTIATLAPIAGVRWYYVRERNAIEAATLEQLYAIADAKAEQITNWRNERTGDGHVLESASILQMARRALSGSATAADREGLLSVLRSMERSFFYTSAALVDRDGRPRLQSGKDNTRSPALSPVLAAAMREHGVLLSDLYRETGSNRTLIAVVVPVDQAGAFILESDASRFLYPYLQERATSGRTGETSIVRRDGDTFTVLSPRRHLADAVFNRQVKISDIDYQVVSRRAAGASGRWNDYRGKPVIGVLRQVANSPWYLVVKIDQDEVYAPLRRLAWEAGIVVVLLVLTGAAGVLLVWRRKQLREHLEREEWFRTIANDTPAYLWMYGPDTGNTFINRRLQEFLGAPQQPLGRTWPSYVHSDEAGRAESTFLQCLAERCEYQDVFRLRRHDGEHRWMACHGLPRFSPHGEFLGYAGALVDITQAKNAQQSLRESNAALARELEERKRTEEQVHALTQRVISTQEEERTRIARELHDDLGQQVAAVSIALSSLKRRMQEACDQEAVRAQADRLHHKLAELAENIRRLSHQLHPSVLTHSGLAEALEALCSEFSALTGVRAGLSTHGSFDDASPGAVLALYRITQEALQNVARHAHVGEAHVELARTNGTLRLVVSDLGVGMDLSTTGGSAGLGLVSIRERTKLLNGRFAIASAPGAGTTLTVEIPDQPGKGL